MLWNFMSIMKCIMFYHMARTVGYSYSFEITNIYADFTFWRIQFLIWINPVLKLKLSWHG